MGLLNKVSKMAEKFKKATKSTELPKVTNLTEYQMGTKKIVDEIKDNDFKHIIENIGEKPSMSEQEMISRVTNSKNSFFQRARAAKSDDEMRTILENEGFTVGKGEINRTDFMYKAEEKFKDELKAGPTFMDNMNAYRVPGIGMAGMGVASVISLSDKRGRKSNEELYSV